jgi:uncharacterized protein DUF4351
MQQTWAEKLEANKAEGRAEGKAQGAREILLRLLRQRFGTLPTEAERRIQEVSSLDRLTRLADQVLVARSLKEMGLA